MKRSKMITLLLAAMMVISAIPVFAYDSGNLILQQKTYEAPFADTQGTWCDSYVQTCYESGLMEGRTATEFDPAGEITYEQIIVIAARLYELLTGGDGVFDAPAEGAAWYMPAYDELSAAVTGNGGQLPEALSSEWFLSNASAQACERFVFVDTLFAALSAANVNLPVINSVSQIPDTSDSSALAFYRAGILDGIDSYGSFNGTASLTRGQAAAILARIADPAERLTFTLKPFDLCRDVLGLTPDTVLLTIDGTEVTAAQYGDTLVTALLTVPWTGEHDSVKQSVGAIKTYCTDVVAMQILADRLGLSLTEADREEATKEAANQSPDGYKGLSEETWYWKQCNILLTQEVQNYYIAHYGYDGTHGDIMGLNSDLAGIAEDLTIQTTEVYDSLDMNAVYAHAKSTPAWICWAGMDKNAV